MPRYTDDPKEKMIKCRLDAKEYEKLSQVLKKKHMTVTEFLRKSVAEFIKANT